MRVISITGDEGRLPRDPKKNTAAVAVAAFLDKVGHPFGVDIALEKRMPLSSGLGSSAASAVAAATAANILAGTPLSPIDLLPFTMEAERIACGSAHADNVAPSLLGGFVLIRSYEPLDVVRLPVPKGLSCAVVHPHAELRTEDARRVLKKEIRLSDAIRQWGNLAALVAALLQRRPSAPGQVAAGRRCRAGPVPPYPRVRGGEVRRAGGRRAGVLHLGVRPVDLRAVLPAGKTRRGPGRQWSQRSGRQALRAISTFPR